MPNSWTPFRSCTAPDPHDIDRYLADHKPCRYSRSCCSDASSCHLVRYRPEILRFLLRYFDTSAFWYIVAIVNISKYNILIHCSYSKYTKVKQDLLTAERSGRGGCWRLPVHAWFRRPRPLQAPARGAGTWGFDSSSWGISDFELQGVRLLRCSPSSFDTCFGIPCALRRVPSASHRMAAGVSWLGLRSSRTNASMEAWSANRSPKCASKPDVLV